MSQASDFAAVVSNIVTLMDSKPLAVLPDSWHTIQDIVPLTAAQQFAVWVKTITDYRNFLPQTTEVRNTAIAMGIDVGWPPPA